MAYSKDVKNQARNLYIETGLSLEAIANELKIGKNTVLAWKSGAKAVGDDWEKMRALNANQRLGSLGQAIVVQLLINFEKALVEFSQLEDTPPLAKVKMLSELSESFNRAIIANKRLSPELQKWDVVLEVIDDLTEFIKQHEPDKLKTFGDILEPFGEYLKVKK